MAEAKLGPMGLQCDKLQRDDLDHCRQPLQERRRGHSKTGNVPTTNRIKEERAQKLTTYLKSHTRKRVTLRLVCSDFFLQQRKMQKLDVLRGVWSVDTPCMCRVRASLCARFVPTIKWHRVAAHFGLHVLQNNKMGVFLKRV